MKAAQRGITLIEVLVALVVLSVALIGTFRFLSYQAASVSSFEDRLMAHFVAQNRLAEMELMGVDAPGLGDEVMMGAIRWSVETNRGTDGTVSVRVTAPGRAGALLQSAIPADEAP